MSLNPRTILSTKEEVHLALVCVNLQEFNHSGYDAMADIVETDHDMFLWRGGTGLSHVSYELIKKPNSNNFIRLESVEYIEPKIIHNSVFNLNFTAAQKLQQLIEDLHEKSCMRGDLLTLPDVLIVEDNFYSNILPDEEER